MQLREFIVPNPGRQLGEKVHSNLSAFSMSSNCLTVIGSLKAYSARMRASRTAAPCSSLSCLVAATAQSQMSPDGAGKPETQPEQAIAEATRAIESAALIAMVFKLPLYRSAAKRPQSLKIFEQNLGASNVKELRDPKLRPKQAARTETALISSGEIGNPAMSQTVLAAIAYTDALCAR